MSHFLSFGQRQGKDGHLFDDDLHGCVTPPAADPNFIFWPTIPAMKIYYLHRRRLLQGRRRRHELVSVVRPTWSAVRHAGRRRRKRRVENIGQIVVKILVAQHGRRNAAVRLTTTWFHHSVRHNSHRFNAATLNVRLQIRVRHNLNSNVFQFKFVRFLFIISGLHTCSFVCSESSRSTRPPRLYFESANNGPVTLNPTRHTHSQIK